MTSHVIAQGDITMNDLEILGKVRQYVGGLNNGIDCHTVCSLIERYLGLGLIRERGWFSINGWDHSWLVIPGRDIIVDPYPWCCASGPIMVYTGGTLNPWRDLYIERISDEELVEGQRIADRLQDDPDWEEFTGDGK